MEGPQGSFAQYVEWVLVNYGSLFTICPAEEDTTSPNSAMDPEPGDQVHKLAPESVIKGILVEFDGMDWSSPHTHIAEV